MKIRCLNCMKEYEEEQSSCPECGFVKNTPPEEIYHLYPGVELADRYIIGTVAAYGGFGVLYKAWDKKLETMVAVKEYFYTKYANRNPGEREIFLYTEKQKEAFEMGLNGFLDEAKNTAKFSSHKNIVNVYDYFRENNTAYMVMEYMDGITLKEHLKEKGGTIPWEKAVEIGVTVCGLLKDVHAAGILHRDISPDNIMLCKDGTVKLFDFGAARFSDLDQELTREVILKVGFAPPEQYRKKSRQGPYTDIYALGATLYLCITGQRPDESVNRRAAVQNKEPDTLKPLSYFTEGLPEYLERTIKKAMALESELRFQNAAQLKDALQNKKSCEDLEQELARRKRKRKAGILSVLLLLAAGSGFCMKLYVDRQNEAYLEGTEISVWLPVESMEQEEKETQVFLSMAAEFQKQYPKVGISIMAVPESEYRDRLLTASDSDFPVLFEHVGDENAGAYESELSDVYAMVDLAEYYLKKGEKERFWIPLGMNVSVEYTNINLEEDGILGTGRREEFLKGESKTLISDTGDYYAIQNTMPAMYSVKETEDIRVYYTDLWSVSAKAGKLEKLAAKRLLYYFLSEQAQDVLHLQNENALPVNIKEFDSYLSVNQELQFLKEQLEHYQFEEE